MARIWNFGFDGRAAASRIAVLALCISATAAFAAVPTVVVDAQLPGPSGFNAPNAIAMAPNNTYYIADSGNNQVLAFTNGNKTTVSTGGYTLVNPQALAVDKSGNLYIGDSPTSGTGRVLEAVATNGVLNGTVNLIVSGGPVKDVFSLAVSAGGTLYIGDDVSSTIFQVAPGSGTASPLPLTGLPAGIQPSTMAVDNAGNLFIGDLNSTLYEAPAGTTSAQTVVLPSFTVFGPTGLAFDPSGNLYILTLTSTAPTPSQQVSENIIKVPLTSGGAYDTANAYRIPFTGPQNASGIGIDRYGTIYILDFILQDVTELVYGTPVNLGAQTVGMYGTSPVTANFEMNASFQQGGFGVSSEGDVRQSNTAESVNWWNTCQNLIFDTGSNGGPISPGDPYLCETQWVPNPQYPGVRDGSIQFYGTGRYVLASIPFYETGIAGASVVHPLDASTGARNLGGPLSIAISGLDQSMYVVDQGNLLIQPRILKINGPSGTSKTTVSTAPVTLNTPTGIAINYQGDLYVADANFGATGQIVVIPAFNSQTPYSFNPGGLLDHPIALTFDSFGNLLIADSGPAGLNGDAGNPGYLVEVPVGGGPAFKVNTGGTVLIYPESIQTNPYTRDIYVGDAGDPTGAGAKVVRIPPEGGSAVDVTPSSLSSNINPAGIAFDPSGQYYILDSSTMNGSSYRIIAVPPAGAPYILPVNDPNSTIDAPDTMAITNGGQNFVLGNYGNFGLLASNNLVFLSGTSSTMDFGRVVRGQQSGTMSANLMNIGSTGLTLGAPYYSANKSANFNILGTTTCANSLLLAPAGQCQIDAQFAPATPGKQTQVLTFTTDGYQTNDSTLTLTGRGTSH